MRKDLPSPNASNFLPRVREEIHALLGKLGSASDRALTLRDAIDSGVIVPGPGGGLIPGPGAGGGGGDGGTVYVPDLTPPPPPGSLTATAAISHVMVEVPAATYTQGHGHLRTRLYAATRASGAPAPVFADAVEVGQFSGAVWAMPSNPATTWHLWAKWESVDNVLSATPAGGTNGVVATTAQDVSLLLDALAGQIMASELHSSLGTPISLIPSLSAAIGTMQTELAELSGTPEYDNAEQYEPDQTVKYAGGLYRATQATTGNLPTNTVYWQKIGDYSSLGDAVAAHAAQLSVHGTRITQTEGAVTSIAEDITQLETSVGSNASSITAVSQAVTNNASSTATQINTLQSRVGNGGNLIDNSEFARDLSGWDFPAAPEFTNGRNLAPQWTVGPGTAYIAEEGANANPAHYVEAVPTPALPVVPGKRYQWSIYTAAHRCLVQAFIYWLDGAGTAIGYTPLDGNDDDAWGGAELAGYKRLKSFGTAPAGAATARPILRKTTTKSGQANSYAFFTKAHFAEASSTQTEPDAYSPGQLVASLQVESTTRASQTGELYAQYTVKLDVGGKVSGFGLASTGPTGAGSSFAIRADRFYIAPPASGAGDATADIIPFVVQATATTINGVSVPAGVYVNDLFVKNGTITNLKIANEAVDNSKIANLSASKLTAGTIAVGQYIQGTGYTPGMSSWRINGDGSAEFNQVVVRGTIFASQGAIGGWNIGANYLQSTTYALGTAGTRLNSDGTGQIGGVRVTANTVESHTFDSSDPYGFRLRNDGASEFKGAVIKSGTGKILLSAVGDAVPPWVTVLQQADEDGISLVADPDPLTNTAKLKSLRPGYGIDLETTDLSVTISEIPRAVAVRANQTQNSTTWASVQGVSWPVDADSYYEFEGVALTNNASGGKQWNVAFLLPVGSVGSGVGGVVTSSSGFVDSNYRLVFGATQEEFSGPSQVSYYGQYISFKGFFYTSLAGIAQVQFRRQSGTGSNTIQRGSVFSLRKASVAPELGSLASPQTIPSSVSSAISSQTAVTPGVKLTMSTNGTWSIVRNGTSTLTGNWLDTAPVSGGQAGNFDVKFEFSPRVFGGSGPNYRTSAQNDAYNWVQLSYSRVADYWMDVGAYVQGETGTRTCDYTLTVKVRQRSTGVETTLAAIAVTLSGTIT